MIADFRAPTEIDGPLTVTECEALAELAAASNATAALEVGHYLGRSTAVLLQALPAESALVTIDHHWGDKWAPETLVEDFQNNIRGYLGTRSVLPLYTPMDEALATLGSWRFNFVFYDADHTAPAVAAFWRDARGLLADECTLVYDDGDWDDQATLRTLAETDGFVCVRTREFKRHPTEKRWSDTYTLEVMRRG